MAEGPINYSGLLTQLNLQPLQQGLAQRRQNQYQQTQIEAQQAETQQRTQAAQLAQRQFELKAGEQQAYVDAVTAYKGNPTPEALRDLSVRFPDHAKELSDAANSYSTSQKNDIIGTGSATLGALSAGNTELAIRTLSDRKSALAGAGVDTSHTDAIIDMIRKGDTKGAQAMLSYVLAPMVGSDHVAGMMETLGIGAKSERAEAAAERDERRLDQNDRRIGIEARRADATIAQGNARVELSRAAGARAATKAKSGGKGGSKLPAGFVLD